MKRNMLLIIVTIILLAFITIKWVVPYFQHRPIKPSYKAGTTISAQYGKQVEYDKFERIIYPDFVVTYTGITYKSIPGFGPAFMYYNFNVLKIWPEHTDPLLTTINWTAGTGVNSPYDFSVQNRNYELLMQGENITINKLEK